MTGNVIADLRERLETAKVDLALFKPFNVLEILDIVQQQQTGLE